MPVILACLALALGLPAQAQAQQGQQQEGRRTYADESLLAPIRLAARGGDYQLAQARLARLERLHLISKGHAAIASEYARDGLGEKAEEHFTKARTIAADQPMRGRLRVSSYLYLARMYGEREETEDEAHEMLDEAYEQAASLAGIDLDMSLIELAQVTVEVSGDFEQAQQVLQLIQDTALRDKLLHLYGFLGQQATN